MQNETRASLQFFIEKAHELRLCNFAKYLTDGRKVNLHISISSEHGEKVEYTGPDDEAMRAFLLTLRFFIQDRDRMSFRYLAETVRNDPGLSARWRQEIKEARDHLTQYLNGRNTPIIVYEPPPTRKEILDTFIYGHMAHSEERYRDQFKRWRQNEILFSSYKMDFQCTLFTMFSLIMYISELSEQELTVQ